jgi:hypothetical protein
VAAALLEHVPLPSSAAALQNLDALEEQERQLDQFSVRLDHRLSDTSQVFARFSTFDANERQPFGAGALQEALVPGFGRTLMTRTRNGVASHTHVFGTSVLNELRVGWLSVRGGQASVNRGIDFAGNAGLLGVTRDPRDIGFPQVSFGGLYASIGDPTSFVSRNNTHFELYENVTLDRGTHRVKFGAYYFHLKLRPEQPDNARGAFTFTGQFSGNAFADFLLGYPASATSGIGRGDEDGRTNWIHLYVQDDWQVRQNLTLNLGLRYEFNQHMYDVRDRLRGVLEMRKTDPSGENFGPESYVFGNEVGEKISYSTFKKGWKQARKAAGGNGLHFHDLRREFASRLLETPGVSLHDVADWVGHSNVTTTSRYLKTTAVRRQHIAMRFEASRRLPTPISPEVSASALRGQDLEAES